MRILRHMLLLVFLLTVSGAFSQAVRTDFDKKIIITDSLNVPGNTNASTVISMLPELLQRPGDYILSNYDVKIEGMSVGSAADVALLQLQIVDIEKIEVSARRRNMRCFPVTRESESNIVSELSRCAKLFSQYINIFTGQ